jgi:prophage tail gpP-like protein
VPGFGPAGGFSPSPGAPTPGSGPSPGTGGVGGGSSFGNTNTAGSQYASQIIGVDPDDVAVVLNGQQVFVAESWELHESVLEQPSVWSIRMGSGASVQQFLQYQPRTPFQLYVGGVLQASGLIDSRRVSGGGTGASEVVISGRDALAPVHDSHVDGQFTFTDTTYTNLVWDVLAGLNLVSGSSPDPFQLASTNDANRQIKCGASVSVLKPVRPIDQILTDDAGNVQPVVGQFQITAKPGETWMSFLRRYLDPSGLTLWAAANGTFVLSEPNVNQAPLYQITRRAVNSQAVGNATSYEFIDNCTHRHSACIIYGRGGGRKLGVSKIRGSQVDPEMGQLGYNQVRCHHETHCQSQEMAENYALRKLAEERREGYQLWYTVPGHTLPLYSTGGSPQQLAFASGPGSAVITVDTVVQVNDEELGISAPFYIDSLVRSRSPHTSTKIRLVRPGDIVLQPTPATSVQVPAKATTPVADIATQSAVQFGPFTGETAAPAASSSNLGARGFGIQSPTTLGTLSGS